MSSVRSQRRYRKILSIEIPAARIDGRGTFNVNRSRSNVAAECLVCLLKSIVLSLESISFLTAVVKLQSSIAPSLNEILINILSNYIHNATTRYSMSPPEIVSNLHSA